MEFSDWLYWYAVAWEIEEGWKETLTDIISLAKLKLENWVENKAKSINGELAGFEIRYNYFFGNLASFEEKCALPSDEYWEDSKIESEFNFDLDKGILVSIIRVEFK